ncbi:MAG: hypothetical protein EA390_03675 [Balneolaceae bacterium]|nr:MAG: hypothetical protein EA390_03675 [Balneolaceae bacterium]
MIPIKLLTRPVNQFAIFTLFFVLLFAGCVENNEEATNADIDGVIEVTAMHDHVENLHLFELSSKEIPSGWTTFQFNNASPVDHFFLIYRVPDEGIEAAYAAGEPLLDHWFQGVTEPFQLEFNPFVKGDIDYGEFTDNLVGAILERAPWFFDPGAAAMGGPGFTAARATSKTTVHLPPGEYIVECYVKDENEVFHSYIGMLEQLTVTGEDSEIEKPVPTSRMTISSTNGIQIDEELHAGNHTIEIIFEDQDSYAHLLGHNVQLAKLADKNDEELLRELAAWMDWRHPGSLVDRAPGEVEFLGGTMEMTEGATAYFHVDLEPGDYVWIAEIPAPANHDMLKTFTVGN